MARPNVRSFEEVLLAEDELEKIQQSYFPAAEQARLDYLELYDKMISELSPTHLEPFTKELLERENYELQNQEELVAEIKRKLLDNLQNALNRFWKDHDVTFRIAALSMLKEHYKEFEGRSWNIQKMNPRQRTLPLRMRFKETRLRHLQRQVEFQLTQLEEIMATNRGNRELVHDVEEKRTYLRENMPRYIEFIKQKEAQIIELNTEVLEAFEGKEMKK